MSASLGGTDDRAFRWKLSHFKIFGNKQAVGNGQTNAHVDGMSPFMASIIPGVSGCSLFAGALPKAFESIMGDKRAFFYSTCSSGLVIQKQAE